MIKNNNSKIIILKIALGVISIAIVFMVGIMSIDNSYAGKTISYTGRLRDSLGNVVGESNEGERFDMVFRLYNSPSGGSLVWGPEVHYNVLVKYGYFGVDLGSILPINLPFNEDYYVSVAVKKSTASGFDSEMYPRAKLSSSAYSFTSENVNGGLNKDVYIRTTSGRNIYLLGNSVGIGVLDPKQALDVNGNIGVKGIFINDIRKDDLWDLAYAERGSQIAGTGLIWSDGVLSIVNPFVGTDLEFLAETRELNSSTGMGVTLPLATTNFAGLMSEVDKDKLDGIASGAQPGTVTGIIAGAGLNGGLITTFGTISTNATTCGAGEYSYWTGTGWACRMDQNSDLWTQVGSDIYYNTGNVGVGVTAPTAKLHVVGSGGNGNYVLNVIGGDGEVIGGVGDHISLISGNGISVNEGPGAGGSIFIKAGDGGSRSNFPSFGADGGDIELYAGDSDLYAMSGGYAGDIYLSGGTGKYNGNVILSYNKADGVAVGNVGIGTDSPTNMLSILSEPGQRSAINLSNFGIIGETKIPSSATGWNGSSNVYLSDDQYATYSCGSPCQSPYLDITGFGFTIPINATIVGIEATLEGSRTLTNYDVSTNDIYLLKNGIPSGDNKQYSPAFVWENYDKTVVYGGSSDLWGTTWSPSQVNASNFGFRIRITAYNETARVDQVVIKVYYVIGDSWTTGIAEGSESYQISYGNDFSSNNFLTLLKGGNVGIGTTTPGNKLEISGGLSATGVSGFISSPYAIVAPKTLVNVGTGALTSVDTTATGSSPTSVAVDPTGRFVYVTNNDSNTVQAYTINQSTGALTSVGTSATGSYPDSIAVDPTGRFVYLTNDDSNTIQAYTINQSTGALTSVGTTATGPGLRSLSIDPTGRFVYVVRQYPAINVVEAYSINQSTGVITFVGSTATGSGPLSITVDPTGRFVYVGRQYQATNAIEAYSINQSTGVITFVGSTATGSGPRSITVDPTGRFVYVANYDSHTVEAYTVNQTTGVLTSIGTVAGNNPMSVAVDPTGRFAYVANSGSNTVQAYTVNQSTGALKYVGAVAAGDRPFSAAVDSIGRFTYVVNRSSNTVQAYTINNFSAGSAYFAGNVGIGTTSPTSVLHTVASGAKTANYIGNLLTNTATSSTASVIKTGLSVESTGTWNGDFAVNRGLYVNATGGWTNYSAIFEGGNVGIGTTTPGALLQLGTAGSSLGTMRMTGNTAGYVQIQPSATAGDWTLTLPANDGDNGQFLTTDGSGVTSWATVTGGANTSLSNLSSVAINTSLLPGTDNSIDLGSATYRWRDLYLGPSSLKIYNQADATNYDRIQLGYESDVATLRSTNGGTGTVRPLQLTTGSNVGMYIDTSGNVGIGTTSPSQKLHVDGSVRITGALYDSSNSAGTLGDILTSTGTGTAWSSISTALDGSYFKQGGNAFTAEAVLGTTDNYNLSFKTNDITRMFIGASGNIGVGTDTPDANFEISDSTISSGSLFSLYSDSDTFLEGNFINANFVATLSSQDVVNSGMLNLSRDLTSLITKNSPVFDSTSSAAATEDVSSLSWSHTVNSASNRILIVGISYRTSRTVSSVTYNGEAMTLLESDVLGISQAYTRTYFYYLINPDSGTHDVVVTLSGATELVAGATSYSNVNQSSPFSNVVKRNLTSYTSSSTLTSSSNIGDTIVTIVSSASQDITEGEGQIALWNANATGSGAGSSKEGAAGTTSVSYSRGSNTFWAMIAATLVSTGSDEVPITGALAQISSNCTESSGTCQDSSNLLYLNQQFALANGAIINISNSGTGADIAFNTSPILRLTDTGAMTWDDGTNSLMSLTDEGTTGDLYVSGSLGLGVESPTYTLDIDGDANLSTGSVFRINGTEVLSTSSLGSGITSSSLTAVGTIGTGTWNANTIDVAYGGTGLTSYTTGDLLYASGTTTISKLGIGTVGKILTSSGTAPQWQNVSDVMDSSYFKQGGNEFTASAVLGTTDNYALSFKTNDTTKMSIGTDGKIGIGTSLPSQLLGLQAAGNVATSFETANVTSTGFVQPAEATQLEGIGTLRGWVNDSNIIVQDGNSAYTNVGSSISDEYIHIMDGYSVLGDNKAQSDAWPGLLSISTYGAQDDLWGIELTPEFVNSSTFGIGINVCGSDPELVCSKQLIARDFGFVIPSDATILGIEVRIVKAEIAGQALIDSVKVNVYYAEYSYIKGVGDVWSTGVDISGATKVFRISASGDLITDNYLSIDETGVVGIGVSSPTTKLDVDGLIRVRNPQGETSAPTRSNNGEFAFADVGGNGRIYFRSNGTDYYINASGTGDISEYFKKADGVYKVGMIMSIDENGLVDSSDIGDNPLGVVSEFGTRGNDLEGERYKDPDYLNVGLLGQVPTYVMHYEYTELDEFGEVMGTNIDYVREGDQITVSSLSGIGKRAIHRGYVLGKSLGKEYEQINPERCIAVESIEELYSSLGNTESTEYECYYIPVSSLPPEIISDYEVGINQELSGIYVGKITTYVNPGWYEPKDEYDKLAQLLSQINGVDNSFMSYQSQDWVMTGNILSTSSDVVAPKISGLYGVFDILQVERFEIGGDKFVVDSLGNVSVGGKVIINESLEVYKDVKIDGNLFVGGTIETEKLIIGGEETSRWLGVRTSHPLNAQEGDMYYNKTDKEVYVFVDGNWEIIVN